ncbi:Rossmann-like and DUF2520 domain-containing protein [Isoptericola cucumis]|uniref:Short-subunit dehydrogenase-like oxidoreductase (DUF2520 family) n=1 Tax=Isoptericola cucumis TaxID=1776856 RepID=A0ABQ2B588_9MICO|nr:DUF2520 domain-containing protein [Isoptericola cucumis]GGI05497.1 hypothetical protein GCM10007368_06450 [Isoptericola cucumis]
MSVPAPGASRPGRLGVGVVGAGRVGAVLGSALRSTGHVVVGASGVSDASLERIETLLPGVPHLEVPQVVERAELVLLAVPDDELAEVVAGLAALGAWQPGQLVVHTSGRYGTAVLEPALAVGAIPLAIHPAMTFTGTSLDLHRLTGSTFAVTAAATVQPIGQALVVELGGEPVIVDEAARGLYHAALAHGSNHLVVLVAQAAQALEAAGIERPGQVLAPLLGAALDGAVRSADVREGVGPGAIAALTGPVSRGDVGTVRAHLDALAGLGTTAGATDVPTSYAELARAATRRALAAHRIDATAARTLLDTLNPPPADPPDERPDPPDENPDEPHQERP